MSDGGGGGQPQVTSSASTLPAYAQPYMEDLMGRAQALTSTTAPVYGGERIAGFTPLQQQAFQSSAGLAAGPQDFASKVGSYMSPYMQNVVDAQKREAQRVSDIAGQKQQAGAAQAGAFGGYREAIERAERDRNLGTQLGDIQSKGLQSAYDAATQQYNQGQQQAQQIAGQQAQFGGQQQGVQQQYLTQQYQDFLNQQGMPYKQLGFMSDILHGVPGTQSATSVYTPPPSVTSQMAGLGTLAYGLSKKKGGVIKADVTDAEAKPMKKPAGLAELAISRMK